MQRLPGLGEQGSTTEADGGWRVFCDGSYFPGVGRGGWATILKKDEMIMACSTNFAKSCSSALQMELNGIVAGLQLAESFKCKSVKIMSDSVEAIWALQRGVGHESLQADVLIKGLNLLKGNLDWELRHVFREGNILADLLAKKANKEEWAWDRKDALPVIP